jgi:hypothetical protein
MANEEKPLFYHSDRPKPNFREIYPGRLPFADQPYDKRILPEIMEVIHEMESSPQKEAARVIHQFILLDLNRGGVVPRVPYEALKELDNLFDNAGIQPVVEINGLCEIRDKYTAMIANFENEVERLRQLVRLYNERPPLAAQVPQIALNGAIKKLIESQKIMAVTRANVEEAIAEYRREGGGADDDAP